MKKLKMLIIILIMGSFWSCNREEPLVLDNELIPYFELFEEEGAKRGIIVDFDSARVEGVLETIDAENVTGQCQSNSLYPDRIIIDPTYWANASDMEKEFLVFHELGHCYLNRSHLDSKKSDGSCESMMHSGQSNCRNTYSSSTREAFLDELFLY